MQGTPEPLTITVDGDDRIMRVTWADGHESVYDFDHLRWSCPCATCRGELGRPGLLDHLDHLRPEQTDLVDLRPVGRYAVLPVWCDGHSTGIFTYRYLRDLCQCAACASGS